MVETEEEERNTNKMTTENIIHPLVMINTPREKQTLQMRSESLWKV